MDGITNGNADVAVVIPAFNESTVIGEVIAGVRAQVPAWSSSWTTGPRTRPARSPDRQARASSDMA